MWSSPTRVANSLKKHTLTTKDPKQRIVGSRVWGSRVWGSAGIGPPISDLEPHLPWGLESGDSESGDLLWRTRVLGSTGLEPPISILEPDACPIHRTLTSFLVV